MSYCLKGRNVLITGGSRGLGAAIASRFAQDGANIAVNYYSDANAANNVTSALRSRYGIRTACIKGDVGSSADCQSIVQEAAKQLDGLDVVISNAGWTEFSDFSDLDSMSDEKWDKCWNTNVKGNLNLFKAAKQLLNLNDEGGVFIYTASTAGVSVSGSSLPYSVTKAAALHLIKCLAQTQGPKIRVNAVIPGLLLTDWGTRYSQDFIKQWESDTPLNTIPQVEDCADIFATITQNKSMTGQEIPIDCGWLLTHAYS